VRSGWYGDGRPVALFVQDHCSGLVSLTQRSDIPLVSKPAHGEETLPRKKSFFIDSLSQRGRRYSISQRPTTPNQVKNSTSIDPGLVIKRISWAC
jgi:hypothetical protein